MDPGEFFTAPRVTIVAGKGGVGKTTVAATLAESAARQGLAVLLIDIDGKSALPAMLADDHRTRLGYDAVELSPASETRGPIQARTMDPDDALVDYLDEHGLTRISKRLTQTGALDMVATATPGIKDVLILGKVKQLERSHAADVIIVDAPAAGHAISFLRSAGGLLDSVHVGPIETQARDVLDLLGDPDRCQVVLVALPEETPVNELIDTAYSLEEEVGLALGPVVMNGLLVDRGPLPTTEPGVRRAADDAGADPTDADLASLAAAATFRGQRLELQREQLGRLADTLPLPQIRLPFLFTAELGAEETAALADAALESIAELTAADLGRSQASHG